jgi:hypothetical protein
MRDRPKPAVRGKCIVGTEQAMRNDVIFSANMIRVVLSDNRPARMFKVNPGQTELKPHGSHDLRHTRVVSLCLAKLPPQSNAAVRSSEY